MYKEVLIEGKYEKDGIIHENVHCVLRMSNNKFTKRMTIITEEFPFGNREYDTQFIEVDLETSIEEIKEVVQSGFQVFIVKNTQNFLDYTIRNFDI